MTKVCLCGGEERALSGAVPIREIIENLDRLLDRNDQSGALEFLVYWENEAARCGDLSGQLSVVNERIGLERKAGRREDAYAAAERALSLIGALGAKETIAIATVYLNIATAYCAFGEPERAVRLYERAEEIYRKCGADEERMGGLWNNKATALEGCGRLQEAEAAYQRALELAGRRENGGLDAAVTLVNLAHLGERTGREETEIEALLDRAEALLEDPGIPQNGAYAFVLEKCAPSFDHFGFFLTAKRFRERSQAIYAGEQP